MKLSQYKNYDDLPLFLNSESVAQVLGVSLASTYELIQEPHFPVLVVDNHLVVPKEHFTQWVAGQLAELNYHGLLDQQAPYSKIPVKTFSLCPMSCPF